MHNDFLPSLKKTKKHVSVVTFHYLPSACGTKSPSYLHTASPFQINFFIKTPHPLSFTVMNNLLLWYLPNCSAIFNDLQQRDLHQNLRLHSSELKEFIFKNGKFWLCACMQHARMHIAFLSALIIRKWACLAEKSAADTFHCHNFFGSPLCCTWNSSCSDVSKKFSVQSNCFCWANSVKTSQVN